MEDHKYTFLIKILNESTTGDDIFKAVFGAITAV
jgi:hypothetical protein